MRHFIWLCFCFNLVPSFGGEIYTDTTTGVSVLSANLDLPSEGNWYLSGVSQQTEQLGYAHIEAPEKQYNRAFGQRSKALQDRRLLSQRRSLLYGIRHLLGRDEEKRSHTSLDSIEFKNRSSEKKALKDQIIVILPDVSLKAKNREEAQILLVELKPQINDGKHFVAYNNWKLQREEINHERLEKLGLTITLPPENQAPPETVVYRFNGRLFDLDTTEIQLTLQNDAHSRKLERTIMVDGRTNTRDGFVEWAKYRAFNWWTSESRLSAMWDRQVKTLYGLEDFESGFEPDPNRNRGASLMNVLGGDAAIRETLQMQNLIAQNEETQETSISIEEITGVTVRAHDYAELLGDEPGGDLPLARLVPSDRFFAWFPHPDGILQLLEGSGNILGRFGSNRSKLILDQQILEKHLAKLGLTREQLTLLLQSGLVGESAVILPDLFLAEGTDVTSITQIKNLPALTSLFKGMGTENNGKIQKRTSPSGTPFYTSIQDDWLIFSSSASELELVLQTMAGNEPSLGESAEFRYMLTQCGPTADTAAYVYLSDPFIRRLTGPELKIAQMRRLQAKTELEALSAGALLYRMDQDKAAENWQTLVERGYAPKPTKLQDLSWSNDAASDSVWGSAAQLPTLTDHLPKTVSAQEKKAYDTYREDYERFWRQFFDPIAVRVDIRPENMVETTIFILPLINSSIYDTVRGFFQEENAAPPLQRPIIEPALIGILSMNLSETLWIDFLQGVSTVVEMQLGLNFPIWDQLGPGVHVGLADSDSIITFGSGELLNLFGAGSNLRDDEMLLVPLFGSLLTRPVVVAIELQDPTIAREALGSMMTGTMVEDDDRFSLKVDLVKITNEERWLIRLGVGDMLYLTLSMEIQDRYLVFSNLPLTYRPMVTGSEKLDLRDAALLLQPDAIEKTGPGFIASALDIAREQAYEGMGVLNLYYMAGFTSLEEAMATSQRLFGYVPVHPSPGEFVWTETGPVSSVFGGFHEVQQPLLEKVDPEGLLPRTEKVDISMQLENEGLRTRLIWKGKEK